MKFLRGQDYKTDLKGLSRLLKKEGIRHQLRQHPITKMEPVKLLIGYNPAGEYQIRVGELSVIRGMVSFGDFEIYDGKETIRTGTAEEMVEVILSKLKGKV